MLKALSIQLSVRVSDGSFETQLTFPVDATDDQREWIVKSWLGAIQAAIEGSKVTVPVPVSAPVPSPADAGKE